MKKLWVILAVLSVLAASCGDRGSDSSGGVGGGSTDDPPADEPAGDGDWGDLTGVCGPNEGGGEVPSEDAPGVSADSIALGTVADPGFDGRPGLNQELFDAGEAFADWCNAAGGINGKTIDLTLHDAALVNYEQEMNAACEQDFSLVGGGAVQDNLWTTTGLECDLIDVAGFAVTGVKAGLAGQTPEEFRTIQPVPNPADRYPVGAPLLLDETYPDAGQRMGLLTADFQTLLEQKNKEIQGFQSIGYDIVSEATYNIGGEANWKPFATNIDNDEVSFLKFIGEPENGANLLVALDQIGYEPEISYFETNFYDQNFIDAAGSAADGAFIGTSYVPLEEAADNPATQQYLDGLEAQGGKVSLLGIQSTSAWLLFADLAKQCDLDNNLTRSCILEKAGEIDEWTGAGLHAPTSPATNEGSECWLVLQVADGGFERFAPAKDFACSPDYIATVEPFE